MSGTVARNSLAEYCGHAKPIDPDIDVMILWDTLTLAIPELVRELERALPEPN